MEYNVYKDYFNLACQVAASMKQTENFVMMWHDYMQRYTCSPINVDFEDDELAMRVSMYTLASTRRRLRADSPLLRQFDESDSFCAVHRKFFMKESKSDSPKEECPLPYPKDWKSNLPLMNGRFGAVGSGLVNPKRPVLLDEQACVLCKKNGEEREFYTTHVLKDDHGKVTCPILRKYVCPTCGATRDRAHTIDHCPINKNKYEKDIDTTENEKDIDTTENEKDIDTTENEKDIDTTENEKDIDATENEKDIDTTENEKDIDTTENEKDIDTTENEKYIDTTENDSPRQSPVQNDSHRQSPVNQN